MIGDGGEEVFERERGGGFWCIHTHIPFSNTHTHALKQDLAAFGDGAVVTTPSPSPHTHQGQKEEEEDPAASIAGELALDALATLVHEEMMVASSSASAASSSSLEEVGVVRVRVCVCVGDYRGGFWKCIYIFRTTHPPNPPPTHTATRPPPPPPVHDHRRRLRPIRGRRPQPHHHQQHHHQQTRPPPLAAPGGRNRGPRPPPRHPAIHLSHKDVGASHPLPPLRHGAATRGALLRGRLALRPADHARGGQGE